MGTRLELQSLLEKILGSRNVHYQPPPSLCLNYPAIVYRRNEIDTKRANNRPYSQTTGYLVTVIDPNPDSKIVYDVSKLPMCELDRHYTANNLNHDVFRLFY